MERPSSVIASKPGIDAGVVVADLDATLPFYRDLLGLEEVGRRTTGWGTMVELAFGETVLRLLQPPTAPEPLPAPTAVNARAGIRYLTFPVSDFDATVAACTAAGTTFALEPKTAGAVRFAIVADPEGNLVEFLTREEAT
jgi:catechol 2,3-dioxygenase-like lactoylglutathione lyase family enzyme